MPELMRAADRFHTVGDGVQTWHSFSYGAHYDPERIGFGAIMAVNIEHVSPGGGYEIHAHAGVEIVTWVLRGVLRHEDSTGQAGDIRPGTVQRLSAGTGVEHSERNGSDLDPLVFVQMMLRSDHDAAPEYAQVEVDQAPCGLIPTVAVHAPAELLVARLVPGQSATIPASPRCLVIVTSGTVRSGEVEATVGDELRFTDGLEHVLEASAESAALVWSLHA